MPDTREKAERFFYEAFRFSLSDHFPVAHAQSMWYNVIQQIECVICFKWQFGKEWLAQNGG